MKIVVALDLSKHAEAVLKKAVEMAKSQAAELGIITVAEDFSDVGDYLQASSEISAKLRTASQQACERYAQIATTLGVAARSTVLQGVSPADVICTYAEKEKADLIIMGHRAKRGIDRYLIGSVASRVVSHAPCSVLVVR
jgi:nucleotide-binding universal stress UspA family protein